MSLDQNQNGNGSYLWRTIAIALIAADLTGFGGWIAFGLDSVKHSEIDQIMATRAPYMHDKQRIEDKFNSLNRRVEELENQYHEILKKRLDAIVP